jgi:hypothetical protein
MLHIRALAGGGSQEAPKSLLASFCLQPIRVRSAIDGICDPESGSARQRSARSASNLTICTKCCCPLLWCVVELIAGVVHASRLECYSDSLSCSLYCGFFIVVQTSAPIPINIASSKHHISTAAPSGACLSIPDSACPTADARSRASEINASLRLRQCTRLPARRPPPRNASTPLLLTQTPTRTFSRRVQLCILLDQTSETSSPPSCIFTPTLTRPPTSLCHPIAAPTTTHNHTPQQHETQPQPACLAKGCCLQRNRKGSDPPDHH